MTPSSVATVLAAVATLAVLLPSGAARRLRSVRARGPGAGTSVVAVRRTARPLLARLRARRPGRRRDGTEGDPLEAVVGLLDRLSALSRAGLPPHRTWEQLAATPGPVQPTCAYVAESLATGGSAGQAVHRAALVLPSGRGGAAAVEPVAVLRWLAVATTVSERTGAPAAEALDRLAAAVRAEVAASDERAAALAGPRATAQVLGWLPAAGVLLGALVGANPLRTLLLTGPGRICLLLGAGLWLAGRAWSAALVRAAARAGG